MGLWAYGNNLKEHGKPMVAFDELDITLIY